MYGETAIHDPYREESRRMEWNVISNEAPHIRNIWLSANDSRPMRSIRGRDDLFTRATVHIGLRVMWMMRLDFYIHVPLALAMSVCIKRENRNTVTHCIGDMHLSGKVHTDGQFGVRFPGGAHFLNDVFHFLIAVCEYSYQFHPIGLWCGSIPHGVTILFFHRV